MELKCLPRLLIFIVFLTLLNSSAPCQYQAVFKSDSIACDTFPPPRNLDCLIFDWTVHLWWKTPKLDSITPVNLVAYKLYLNGEINDSIPYFGEDTTHYFDTVDIWFPPGYSEYEVSAIYDLNDCGLPGSFSESPFGGTLGISGYPEPYILSYIEDWNTGSFSPGFWMADESWSVDGTYGHPYPCATYSNLPDSAYRQGLISYWINCKDHPGTVDPYIDGDIYLEFDLKLNHLPVSGIDYLNIEITDSMEWQIIEQFSTEEGSFEWTYHKINITEWAKGEYIRFSFVAQGEDGENIHDWFIDNIKVSRECNPPRDLQWVVFDEIMAWSPPEPHTSDKGNNKELQGYRIYYDLTPLLFTTDTIYQLDNSIGYGPYYVIAVYEDCEPASNYIYGPQEIEEVSDSQEIKIFPNPCDKLFTITSSESINRIRLLNTQGKAVFSKTLPSYREQVITSSFPNGIYFLEIQSGQSTKAAKIIIHH